MLVECHLQTRDPQMCWTGLWNLWTYKKRMTVNEEWEVLCMSLTNLLTLWTASRPRTGDAGLPEPAVSEYCNTHAARPLRSSWLSPWKATTIVTLKPHISLVPMLLPKVTMFLPNSLSLRLPSYKKQQDTNNLHPRTMLPCTLALLLGHETGGESLSLT